MNYFLELTKAYIQGKKSYINEVLLKNKRVYDMGCGYGTNIAVDPEKRKGIDINKEAIAHCKKQGYKVTLGTLTTTHEPDNSYEAVLSLQVIEHLEHNTAHAMLTEAARILEPKGLLIISTEHHSKVFWNTFTHVKPYPPQAIKKMITKGHGQENHNKVTSLEWEGIYHTGKLYKNKLLNLISTILANITPYNKYNYTLILKKKD